MFTLKPLSLEGIPQALEKAHHYRLLNEPAEAESICLDVLQIDPDNQQALVSLLLALSDRLTHGYAIGGTKAREVVNKLTDDYQRAYYAGIVAERQAKARLNQGGPGAGTTRTSGSAKRCTTSSRQKHSGRQGTMIRFCAGMHVPG